MYRDRIRLSSLHSKVMSAADAAGLIEDGMTVGMSGFTRAGEAKAVPHALAERAKVTPLKISLMTGASLGNDLDKQLTEAGVLARRMPFQVDPTLRRAINAGEVMFVDQHLSDTVEQIRNLQLKKPDIAVIEAVAITEQGHIVPTTSVGNSASFAIFAEQVIVEINLAHNPNLEGLHDIYIPSYRPTRTPIPLVTVDGRIGSTAIPIPAEKIVAIVITNQSDSPSTVSTPDSETQGIANHLIDFLKQHPRARRFNILTNWAGEYSAQEGRRLFNEAGIPTYRTPESAVTAFMHMVEYRRNQKQLMETPASLHGNQLNVELCQQLIHQAQERKQLRLDTQHRTSASPLANSLPASLCRLKPPCGPSKRRMPNGNPKSAIRHRMSPRWNGPRLAGRPSPMTPPMPVGRGQRCSSHRTETFCRPAGQGITPCGPGINPMTRRASDR